jgi:O-antigen/teichoic acid export membrane protein
MTTASSPSRAVFGLGEVGRDYLVLTGGQAAALALGAATVALSTRLLAPAGYGEVAVFLSLVQLLYANGVHWTMSPIIRFGRDALTRRGSAGPEIGTWLALVSTSTIVVVTLAVLAAGPLARWMQWRGRSTGLLVAFVLAVVAAKIQEHAAQMASLMGAYVIGRLIGKLAVLLGLAYIVARLDVATPAQVLLVMAVGFILQAFTIVPVAARQRWGRVAVDPALAGKMAAYAAPLAGRSVAAYLLEWMDVYWLRALRTAAEVGIYFSAYQLFVVIGEAAGVVATLAFPLLTAMRAGGWDIGAYARVAPQLAVAWSLLMGGLGLVLPRMASLIFGPRFDPAAPLIALLLIAASFQAAMYLSMPVFTSHDRTANASALLAAMALFNFLGDLILVPRFGAGGAAVATVVTYGIGAALHAVLLRSVLPIAPWTLVLPTLFITPALLATAGAAPTAVATVAYAAGASLLLVWSRRRIFARGDAALLDEISLPSWLRRILVWVYSRLG